MTIRSGEDADALAGEPCFWLPETAILSFGVLLDARQVECGIVGREGALGWEPLLGLGVREQRIAALTGGTLLGAPVGVLAAFAQTHGSLAATLLRFREALDAQMRWTIAARLQCGPEARLARWLCMLHDRVDGDTLDITHLRLAAFLNARRASITDALHILEGNHVLRCTRGRITVRDRGALEAAAAGSYGAPEALYRQLFTRSRALRG
ncbi:Crp/Fnr family transcriptional regulator [Sphingomonas baiyangensis]|nr:Crp/Fnr family transcriptional regulator [Sphingomonas baiyangensis]